MRTAVRTRTLEPSCPVPIWQALRLACGFSTPFTATSVKWGYDTAWAAVCCEDSDTVGSQQMLSEHWSIHSTSLSSVAVQARPC